MERCWQCRPVEMLTNCWGGARDREYFETVEATPEDMIAAIKTRLAKVTAAAGATGEDESKE